jgi:chromosome segregation ATPase
MNDSTGILTETHVQGETPGANETRYDDVDTGEANAWDDGLDFDESLNNLHSHRTGTIERRALTTKDRYAQFAEADTPPATPYTRSKPIDEDVVGEPPDGVALPDFDLLSSQLNSLQCSTCENASTVDCPCVKRILKDHENGDDSIKIDFHKLLQTEISKRLLIEEESNDLRARLEKLKTSKSAGEVNMETVQLLQQHVKAVEEKLNDAGNECESLRKENKDLASSLSQAKIGLSEWANRQEQWKSKESGLKEEIERTGRQMEMSLTEAAESFESREKELMSQIERKRDAADQLSKQLGALQAECSGLRAENSALAADLESFRLTLAERDQERETYISKESDYDAELQELGSLIEQLERVDASEQDFREQYVILESELAAKKLDYDKLNGEMRELQQRLKTVQAEQYLQVSDQARLNKQHEDEMARLQNELAAVKTQLEEVQRLREQDNNDSKWRLHDLDTEINRLSDEKEVYEQRIRDMQAKEEIAIGEIQSGLDQKMHELHAVTAEMNMLKEHNERMRSDLAQLDSLVEQSGILENQLNAVTCERDSLRNSLAETNEAVRILQQRLDEQGAEESEVEANRNQEIEALRSQRTSLTDTIAANKRQIEALSKTAERLSAEKQSLHDELVALKSLHKSLEASAESTRNDAAKNEASRCKLVRELESLREQIVAFESEREAARKEREKLLQQCAGMDASLSNARRESESNASKVNELEGLLTRVQEELISLREENAAVTHERDQYLARCSDMEHSLAGAEQSSQQASRLAEQNALLSEQARNLQQEFDEQGIVLQNFEARMVALENELTSERQAGSKKDQALTKLRRELELTRAQLQESSAGSSSLPKRIAELETLVSSLEADRTQLEKELDMYASKDEQFHEISTALTEDREIAIRERDALASENEEMLVQFGLLNEKMESYDRQMQELQELVEHYQQASEGADTRLQEMQQHLAAAENARLENGEQQFSDAAARELNELRYEHSKLTQDISELTSANADKDVRIQALELELEGLRFQMEDLEQVRTASEAFATENNNLRSMAHDLEVQRNELQNTCAIQNEELTRLSDEHANAQNAVTALQSRVETLERGCLDRDNALEQKNNEMRELFERLHDASDEPEETQELLMLRDRLNQMEHNARENSGHMHDLNEKYESTQKELKSARQQLSTLEATVEDLEQELITKEEGTRRAAAEQESRLSEVENKLQSKTKEIAELSKEKSILSGEIDTLQSQLEAEKGRYESLVADNHLSAEIDSLKSELQTLQQQLETSSAQHSSREESLRSEVSDLQRSLASKNGEVMLLKRKLQTINEELRISRADAKSKEEALEQLTSQIATIEKQQKEASKGRTSSAAKLLQATKENAEDVDNLRSTVISLAGSLETSESRRADAIDRLVKERETHAESLRHLSDSVKRFYSTLTFSES